MNMWAVPVPSVPLMNLPKFVSFSRTRMRLHLVPPGCTYDTNTSESPKTTHAAPVRVNNQPPELKMLWMYFLLFLYVEFSTPLLGQWSHHSAVGTATGYRLDGPGSNPGRNEIFRPSRPAPCPTQPPVQWVPDIFAGVRRPERGLHHPHPSSAELNERVELHL